MEETFGIYGHIGEILAAVVVIVLGVIVGLGKGDFLISGYNTSSPAKRATYNILRLRLSTVITCVLVAVVVILNALISIPEAVFTICVVVVALAHVVVANTWAKREE